MICLHSQCSNMSRCFSICTKTESIFLDNTQKDLLLINDGIFYTIFEHLCISTYNYNNKIKWELSPI